jgi:radical SAM superfamily enzyme YgiQ (UPF0313 family)
MATMKVLLINPPNLEENHLDAQTIPLGIIYIKEFIKSCGYDLDTLNLYFETSWESVKTNLKNYNYDVVGIPCYTPQRLSVFELAKVCKKINSNSIIVLGGPHATYLDTLILAKLKFIDYIIRGEGEYTFFELLQYLNGKENANLNEIRGLTFRDTAGFPKRNPDRELIENLDILPYPKYSFEDLSYFPKCESLKFHFLKVTKNAASKRIAPALFSRGCSHNCIFCCNGAYWVKQRYHSPTYVFEEIKYMNEKFGIEMFDFYDDNFTASRSHIIELCDLLIASDIHIHWWCSSRANDIDSAILRKMKTAGCFMISYGLESGSQKILNNIKKSITLEHITRAAVLTKEEDMLMRFTISIGNRGENDNTIKETINIIHELQPHQLGIFLVKMYPGTALYQMGVEEGIIDEEYWFDKKSSSVPFYTFENSLESLLKYRDLVAQSLKNKIVNRYEGNAYNLELDLEW